MPTSGNDDFPEEFRVDTSGAQVLSPHESSEHLEQLIGLRDFLANLHKKNHDLRIEQEEVQQAARKQTLKITQTAVSAVDELRRLLADARRNLLQSEAAEQPETGLWGRLLGRGKSRPGTSAASDWLGAIQRHLRSTIQQLERHEIYHVPLVGNDLRELSFQGQALKQWVAVKNRPRGDKLVVVKEYQGLWVGKIDDKIIPLQRGEVEV